MEWRQPETLRRFYQLTLDGREIATLRFVLIWYLRMLMNETRRPAP